MTAGQCPYTLLQILKHLKNSGAERRERNSASMLQKLLALYHQSTNVVQLHKRKCVYVKYSYTFTVRYAKFAEAGVCSTVSL